MGHGKVRAVAAGQWVCRTVAPPFRANVWPVDRASKVTTPVLPSTRDCNATVADVATNINASDVGQHNVPASGRPVQACFLPLPSATLHSKHQLLPSPVSPSILRHVLEGYDNNKTQYLTQGFTQGFRIGCIDLPNKPQLLATNLKAAFPFPDVIDANISKEIKLGRILGSSSVPPDIHNFRVSPLGVVPKSTPGEYRVIHHLSHPHGSSVNDGIPHEFSSVQYATVQDAIAFIKMSPHTIFLGKLDIEAAFRITPVSPLDTPLLRFQCRGKFYRDAVLPMGCSSSCSILEAFSSALEWVAKTKLGVSEMVHYIDDFLFLAESSLKMYSRHECFHFSL